MLPLLPHFLAYAGGMLAAFPRSRSYILPGLLPAGLLASAFALFWSERHLRSRIGWAFAAGWFVFGWLWAAHQLDAPLPENHVRKVAREAERAEVVGQLDAMPVALDDKIQMQMDLESIAYGGEQPIPVSGRAFVTLYETGETFKTGERLKLKSVRVKLPRNFKNPGRFDYAAWLRRQGTDVTINVSRADRIERLPGGEEPPYAVRLREATLAGMQALAEKHYDPSRSALILGMVLGQKRNLPDDLRDAYQATGLAHLLAVSGMNFGFVAGAVFLFYPLIQRGLFRLQPGWARAGAAWKITALAALIPVLAYLALVGGQVSALRAGIMSVLLLLSLLADRTHTIANALLLAAFALLLWNPETAFDAGFQLSFAAVLAILFTLAQYESLYDDPLARMIEKPKWRKIAEEFLLVTFTASLATLPLIAVHFNRVSLISWWSNLVLTLPAMVFMPAALLALACGVFISPQWAEVLLLPCDWLLPLFADLPLWMADLPYASVYLPTPPELWALLCYAALFGLPWWYLKNKKSAREQSLQAPRLWRKPLLGGFALCAAAVPLLLVFPRWPPDAPRPLSAWLLDVGQGESLFVELPDGRNILMDGGGFYRNTPDTGRRVIAPFLWSRGVSRIDYMLATHSDHDHTAGLESLLQFFPVDHLLYAPSAEDLRLLRLRFHAEDRGVRAQPLTANGAPLRFGDATLALLHPAADFQDETKRKKGRSAPSRNNHSLVLRLTYKNFALLMTGDIERRAEDHLANTGMPSLRADVLVVPHHGSKTSSTAEFIQTVKPKAAVISSGYLNIFNHPHPEVLQRYSEAGISVWRTDRDGAIEIVSDGETFALHSHPDL